MTLPASSQPPHDLSGAFAVPFDDAIPAERDWRKAIALLFDAVGYQANLSATASLPRLAKDLRGSGFDLTHVSLIHHAVPAMESMLGYILRLDNGGWLAVLGSNEDAVLLSPHGGMRAAFEAIPMQSVVEVWALTENIISLNSVSPFLRRYKAYFFDLFLAAIIVNVFALTLPLFSSFVYDKILGNGIVETLWALVIGLLIIVGIEFCVRMIRIAVAERFAMRSEVEIDHTTFRNLLNTAANKMPGIGGLLEKYKQILSFRDFLSSSYMLAVADVPFLLLFMMTIAIVAGPLVFVSILCGGVMLATTIALTTPVIDYDRQARAASEKRFGLITDILASREAIIGSALRNKLSERWRQASVAAVQAASKARYWRGLGMTVTGSISYISFIAVLVGGVYMVEEHRLTSGGLLAASMLTSRAMAGFSSIITLLTRYREFRIALRELNLLLPLSAHHRSGKAHGKLRGAVRFDKVTCRLREGDTPVLKDITIAINPGEIVGIAGAPGAGKTTLLRLLAGVVEPDEGKILIDSIPLSFLSPEDVSLNIGFKPQDFCLLSGTIEENVRAGRPALTADMRQDALMTSGLGHIFNEGALDWTTDIGARGASLSGGQRQLVALARALLTRPSLILLDEPTNGLDPRLENYLAEQLAQMRGRSAILVSTHSRVMLSICDRIIVVGQGRILADGPRDKILV